MYVYLILSKYIPVSSPYIFQKSRVAPLFHLPIQEKCILYATQLAKNAFKLDTGDEDMPNRYLKCLPNIQQESR